MSKKNFSGGLDSLFGDSSTEAARGQKEPQTSANKGSAPLAVDLSAFEQPLRALATIQGRTEADIVHEALSFYLEFQVELDQKT